MHKSFFIIITVAIFTAVSFSNTGKVLSYTTPKVVNDTISVGECNPCLGYVINQVNPMVWNPQLDTVSNKMRIIINYKIDSTMVENFPPVGPEKVKNKKK